MARSTAPNGKSRACPCPIVDFVEMVENHRLHVFRFLLASLRDVDLAETLTQECFLKAYRHRAEFRGDSRVSTWLIQIAKNLQSEFWRSRKLQFWRQAHQHGVDARDAESWLPSRQSSPEAQYLASELVEQILEIVKTFSEKRRTVFLLRYIEELSLDEIAQVTGMPEGSVKSNLFHAANGIRSGLSARNYSK
jgi:RNA polymerase sigma-70 factor (ECF subfamily)